MSKEKIDSIISEFKSTLGEETPEPSYQQINIRLTDEYKRKYEEGQIKTKKKLSKLINSLVKYAIDSV